jgi:nucleotide-binding universal stress UspA family protein
MTHAAHESERALERANALSVFEAEARNAGASCGEAQASVEASTATLTAHLARRGRMIADHSAVQPTILSIAADAGLDLIVMGGYGHSRLQERILGGVTPGMLQSMTVPALMSH